MPVVINFELFQCAHGRGLPTEKQNMFRGDQCVDGDTNVCGYLDDKGFMNPCIYIDMSRTALKDYCKGRK